MYLFKKPNLTVETSFVNQEVQINKDLKYKIKLLYKVLSTTLNSLDINIKNAVVLTKVTSKEALTHEEKQNFLKNCIQAKIFEIPLSNKSNNKFDFGKNNLSYNDLYYFSDQSDSDIINILTSNKNTIVKFLYLQIFNFKKFYYTNSFINKMRNIVKNHLLDTVLEKENMDITREISINTIKAKNSFISKITNHYMNNESLTKKDLKKIYKTILVENKL